MPEHNALLPEIDGTGRGFTTSVNGVRVRLEHNVAGSKASAYQVLGPAGVNVLLFDKTGVPPVDVVYQFTWKLPAAALKG